MLNTRFTSLKLCGYVISIVLVYTLHAQNNTAHSNAGFELCKMNWEGQQHSRN